MSEANMEMAKAVYQSICTVLDGMQINYRKVEEDMVILFGHRGKDMNHDLIIAVNEKQEAIQMIEKLPFNMDPSKSNDIAAAVCYANDRLLCGKFSYNMEDRLTFEIAQFFSGSLIGNETIERMLMALVLTVEDFDDKFMALNNGYLKPENFKG